ncbi:MAG: cyclic nucleotide-binding domain-containing protein [Polyangiaceae bacterium]
MKRGRADAVPLLPLALAFFCVGANGLGAIASDTIFVSTFSLGELSRFVGVSALVRVLVAIAYARTGERLLGPEPTPQRALRFDAIVAALAIITFLVSAAASTSSSRAVLYTVSLAQLVLPSLLPLVAFNATTSSLAARHAKRVLPLVAAAATVGSIATGAAATAFARHAGVPAILGLAAALSLPVPWLLVRAARASGADGVESGAPRLSLAPSSRGEPSRSAGALASLREHVSDLRGLPAARVVVAFAFFGALATSFVDYAFKAALKSSYGRDEMAAALAVFSMVSNGLVLVLQIGAIGPLVQRLGVGRTLAVGPSLLGATSIAAFALPPVVGTGLARLSEVVVRYGVGNSVADVLLVPLDRGARTRTKVLVKGAASPLGGMAAGGVLALFGAAGPGRNTQLALLAGSCAVLLFAVRSAPAAYAHALAAALRRGRATTDITPEAALIYRSEVRRQIASFAAAGRWEDVGRTLELMTDRVFEVEDALVALVPHAATRRAAVAAAARIAGPRGQTEASAIAGALLLAKIPIDPDPEIEALVLRESRLRGAFASPARASRAIEAGDAREPRSDAALELWAEGLLHIALRGRAANAPAETDGALKELRRATRDAQRAELPEARARAVAALGAIGALGDGRAQREVLSAMASSDPRVFRQAARAAVRIDAPGVITSLVSRLLSGQGAAAAMQALTLAGPRAVRELIRALPVAHGEGAIAPTAIASGHTMSGTVRAAHALAKIGEAATRETLPLFGDLGHRARVAIARAMFVGHVRASEREQELVTNAVATLSAYGSALLDHREPASADDARRLLPRELAHRLTETVGAIFDLAGTIADRVAIQRARLAIAGVLPGRDDAVELLETVLGASHGSAAARFVDRASRTTEGEVEPARDGARHRLDGWLEQCRKYDARELALTDPMLGVLDKVLVLRDVPLFKELSGEDLYPVAEIARAVDVEAGAEIVKQGDPSIELFVVLEGKLAVERDGAKVSELGPGQAFGELGVLDGAPRAATVRAIAACRLLGVPRSELEGLLDESPELAKAIIRTLLGYVRAGAPR